MAVKRRVIWMEDEDWASLQRLAMDADARSISALIRERLTSGWALRKVEAEEAVRFNTQPFRGPIPKKR